MPKPILFLFLFLINNVGFTQDFEGKLEGITPFIVLNFPNQTASKLYKKTLNWSAEQYATYNKSDLFVIENRKIRTTIRMMRNHYITAELTFKDAKVKFEIVRYHLKDFICIGDQYLPRENEVNLRGWTNASYAPTRNQKRKIMTRLQNIVKRFNAIKLNYFQYVSSTFAEREADW